MFTAVPGGPMIRRAPSLRDGLLYPEAFLTELSIPLNWRVWKPFVLNSGGGRGNRDGGCGIRRPGEGRRQKMMRAPNRKYL